MEGSVVPISLRIMELFQSRRVQFATYTLRVYCRDSLLVVGRKRWKFTSPCAFILVCLLLFPSSGPIFSAYGRWVTHGQNRSDPCCNARLLGRQPRILKTMMLGTICVTSFVLNLS